MNHDRRLDEILILFSCFFFFFYLSANINKTKNTFGNKKSVNFHKI